MTTINSVDANSTKPKKVAVIGAGIAGLTTAYRLYQDGVDVELYEARGRVGGRIFSAILNDKIVELGGHNLSDGGEAANIMKLVQEFNLELGTTSILLDHFFLNESELLSVKKLLREKNLTPETLRKQLDHFASQAANMKEVLDQFLNDQEPLYKLLAVRLAAFEGASLEQLSSHYVDTLYHLLLGGTCLAHQGNSEGDSYLELTYIKKGNALLPETIAKTLGSRVHLNMPLVEMAVNKNEEYQLAFANNKTAKADIVVLAIPCSVFSDIKFTENCIPKEQLGLINSIKYGTNAKLLLPFTNSPQQKSAYKMNRSFVIMTQTAVQQLFILQEEAAIFSQTNIAHCYMQARTLLETGYEEACPPFTLPQYALDKNFLSYTTAIGYSWPSDPYVRGSYSYVSPGLEEWLRKTIEQDGITYKKLFTPIADSLYFAGEHASILLDAPGTVEAACESGDRVAKAILGSLNCL